MQWAYWNPVKIRFGAGLFDEVAGLIGKRRWALVTYDQPIFKALSERLAAVAGAPVATITNIETNPDCADLVESCRRFGAAEQRAEVIVALGGGSMIDAAKVLAASGGDFETVRRHLVDKVPLAAAGIVPIIAVPTTAGTGSEVTSWATVWDAANGGKYSLAHPGLYPETAVLDPALTLAAPRGLTLATGLDALSHALESIWNVNGNPVSANYAVEAAREILDTLPRLLDAPGDLELRVRQMRASLLAGLAFSNTKTALAHNISYDITLKAGTIHGIACSFSLPMVMRWAMGVQPQCDAALRRVFGPDLEAGAERLTAFLHDLGVKTEPSAYGVSPADWNRLVDKALEGERGRNFIGRHAAKAA
ncbi:iron-containing alcohol dehydrogenase PsrA [Bosea sp. 685]|uniref:iron-containing alcohol dehydrogenase PsrA n=1 Tax=Bosea sp. 685 TaxID=3080057 RepID=UPI0028931841|nr:iron-containing alcohol dehydrogenase PsrA [Bosea sp. 685]WNJ88501.1 iron-containing alcohol dehydrogenase PsrA [Bosea sp. 685]